MNEDMVLDVEETEEEEEVQEPIGHCTECGEELFENDETRIDRRGDIYCQSCADDCLFYCEDCGNYHHVDYSRSYRDHLICDWCYDNYYNTCVNCGDVIHRDETFMTGDGDDYCESCYDERGGDSTIQGYHCACKTSRFFDWCETGATRFFGIELEVECRGSCSDVRNTDAEHIRDSFFSSDAIFFEEDGSLNDGYEIITAPMTINYIREHTDSFTRMLRYLRSSGYSSHNNGRCGLHIHVSREGFGRTADERDLTLTKTILIFEKFFDDIVKLSRRSVSSCNQWAAKYDVPLDADYIDENITKASKYDLARYRAINLQPYNTVEFRVFRGTLKDSSFFGAIEFVNAVIDAAMNKSTTDIHNCTTLYEVLGVEEGDSLYTFLSDYGV